MCTDEQSAKPVVSHKDYLSEVFASVSELRSSIWSDYFEQIYGDLESLDFPLDMRKLMYFNFRKLPKEVARLQSADGLWREYKPPDPSCKPLLYGEVYRMGTWKWPSDLRRSIWPVLNVQGNKTEGHEDLDLPGIGFQLEGGFPSGTLVEVSHEGGDPEGVGMWFFYSKGSGIWLDLGRTIAFASHVDSWRAWKDPAEESYLWTPEWFWNATLEHSEGYDSVQFTRMDEEDGIFKYEIVLLSQQGTGGNRRGGEVNGSVSGCFAERDAWRFRSGWRGDRPCVCDPSEGPWLNCSGDKKKKRKKRKREEAEGDESGNRTTLHFLA
uniref:Uncharacterized protein n=1 Tax=Chromera velia CCMP2878 TaxID=1169474 RepID=A0A0G4I918_9ALVE|eukprot:Cvel_12111.t1-p1 / transcript=Cvel_12111.t1 / gene=Cvel_12111 / organism=Chromera_velia_CCMP2878 / gene_product=hypothetical protein / transcript_product=hypothetical protein / location=Cvel_scaffold780:32206-33174(-) / protein_length=323 / sequence_SO=supercontig / SO=protein_coding / is_pseudo=false